MRFLFLNQFYVPDVAPTGKYLHDLARSLAKSGHEVKVLCSRRSYDGSKSFPAREMMDGVEVVRLPATAFGRRGFVGKMSDYVSYYGALFFALMFQRKRPDVILSLTTPPYVGLLGKLAAKRYGCRHAHWIMDLYPDVIFAHGMAGREGLLFRVLTRLTRIQFKGSNCVLALGPTMAKNVAAYRKENEPVASVPLWSDSEMGGWPKDEKNPLREKRGWDAKETVFLYSGNMGLGHRFTEFLEAAKRLGPSGPRWAYSGGGKRRAEIEAGAKSMPGARIEFLEYVPHSQLKAHLCAADIHLASLDSSWQGLMVPSKLQGSFAVGRPVLFVGGRDCETASWILESGGGWVVAENDVEGLLKAVSEALDAQERTKRGRAALEFARKNFLISVNCSRIAELLQQTTQQSARLRITNEVPGSTTSDPACDERAVATDRDHSRELSKTSSVPRI